MSVQNQSKFRLRWRDYVTRSGRRPVKEFLDGLNMRERSAVIEAMKDVANKGPKVARHLRGDVWEVRAVVGGKAFRVLFAQEGKRSQILLSLEAVQKKTQKTPKSTLELAEQRLKDWRVRGRNLRLVR